MADRLYSVDVCTLGTGPRSNGREPCGSLTPDEIIPAGDPRLPDTDLDFYLEHRMRRTAGKQANHLVQVYRQREVDSFRVVQSMKLYNELAAEAAKYMNELCEFRDSCLENLHPDIQARMRQTVDRGLEIQQRLPEAGVMLFLRRYALG